MFIFLLGLYRSCLMSSDNHQPTNLHHQALTMDTNNLQNQPSSINIPFINNDGFGEGGGKTSSLLQQQKLPIPISSQTPLQLSHSLLNQHHHYGSAISEVDHSFTLGTGFSGSGSSAADGLNQSISDVSNETIEQCEESSIKKKYLKVKKIYKKIRKEEKPVEGKQNKKQKKFSFKNSKKVPGQYFRANRKFNKNSRDLVYQQISYNTQEPKIIRTIRKRQKLCDRIKSVHCQAVSLQCHFVACRHYNDPKTFKEIMENFRNFCKKRINKLQRIIEDTKAQLNPALNNISTKNLISKIEENQSIITDLKRAIDSSKLFEDGKQLKSWEIFGSFSTRTDTQKQQLRFYLKFKLDWEDNQMIQKTHLEIDGENDLNRLKELVIGSSFSKKQFFNLQDGTVSMI